MKPCRCVVAFIIMTMIFPQKAFAGSQDGAQAVYYRNVFESVIAEQQPLLDKLAKSGKGETYYTLMYALDAVISMYEATQETRYLDRAIAWEETMISTATIVDRHGYVNWSGDWKSPYSQTPITYELHEFQGSVEIARLAKVIFKSAKLRLIYGTRAQALYGFVKRNIIEKDICDRPSAYDNPSSTSPMDDKTALLLRIFQNVVLIDPGAHCGSVSYAEMLERWALRFKARFTPFHEGIIWDKGLGWYHRGYTAVDTSHANRYVYAAVDLYQAGTVFTRDNIKGLSTLFTGTIWNGSFDNPMFANFIDGSDADFYNCEASEHCSPRPAWGNGLIYDGWINLGEFDPRVQRVGDAVLRAIVECKRNPSLESNASSWGKMELAAHLAKNVSMVR